MFCHSIPWGIKGSGEMPEGRLGESGETEKVGSIPLLLMHLNQSSPDLFFSAPSFV